MEQGGSGEIKRDPLKPKKHDFNDNHVPTTPEPKGKESKRKSPTRSPPPRSPRAKGGSVDHADQPKRGSRQNDHQLDKR